MNYIGNGLSCIFNSVIIINASAIGLRPIRLRRVPIGFRQYGPRCFWRNAHHALLLFRHNRKNHIVVLVQTEIQMIVRDQPSQISGNELIDEIITHADI